MNTERLEYICKLMHQTFRIPIFYLDEQKRLLVENTSSYAHNPLYPSRQEVLEQLFFPDDPVAFPIIRTSNYLENFFSINLKINGSFKGQLIGGPTIDSAPSQELVLNLLTDLELPASMLDDFLAYFQSLPVLSSMQNVYASIHLHFLIYQIPLNATDVIFKNKALQNISLEIEEPAISISKRRENLSFHHDKLAEQKQMQAIKDGKKEEVIKNWRSITEEGTMGTLSKKSHLRNRKNLGITVITLATRAAMEGGLHPETAYTLSDLYIQQMEELKTSKEVDNFIEDAMINFADRVKATQQYYYSKPINQCLSYIFNNLYAEITLTDLANHVNMHPNYLSSLFKQEVGIPLGSYIQKKKVEEAKSLLDFTNYSLLKISAMLGFYDQSYFTKVFKKYEKMTPNQYRNKSSMVKS